MQCVRTGREDHPDTKPPCHRPQREFEFAGVSVAEHGGDKALVLCQPGSQGTLLAFSSRRRRGYPLSLGRAVTTGPQTRGRSLSWGVWTWSAPPRNPHPAAQERLPPCGTACDGVRHARQPCTSCPSPRWALPTTTTLRPAHVWTGRGASPVRGPCSISGRSGVRRTEHARLSMRAARPAPSKALWHAWMRRKPRRRPCAHRCCRP